MAELTSLLQGDSSEPIRSAFVTMGMGTPIGRFAIGSALGALIVYAVRPQIAFNEDGSPKPWSLTSTAGSESTTSPWWGLALIPGVLFAVFI